MADYEKTYEIFDLNNPPELASETDDHYIYYCPYCDNKRGKPDKDGKLYFHKTKLVGFCFLCHSCAFPENKEDFDESSQELKSTLTRINSEIVSYSEIPDPKPMVFDFGKLTYEGMYYLQSRHKYLPLIADHLNCRFWKGTLNGVVFPFYYRKNCVNFQVRFITTDKNRRYYIPKNCEKILYSPNRILDDFKLKNSSNITISEGIFDAIATSILGYDNCLSGQGSTLTNLQLQMIRKLMPETATVIMDTTSISEGVAKLLYDTIPSISKISIINYGDNVDPEEHLQSTISEYNEQYMKNVIKLIG